MRSQAARAAVIFFASDIKDNRIKGGKAVRQMIAQATAGSKQSLPRPRAANDIQLAHGATESTVLSTTQESKAQDHQYDIF